MTGTLIVGILAAVIALALMRFAAIYIARFRPKLFH